MIYKDDVFDENNKKYHHVEIIVSMLTRMKFLYIIYIYIFYFPKRISELERRNAESSKMFQQGAKPK